MSLSSSAILYVQSIQTFFIQSVFSPHWPFLSKRCVQSIQTFIRSVFSPYWPFLFKIRVQSIQAFFIQSVFSPHWPFLSIGCVQSIQTFFIRSVFSPYWPFLSRVRVQSIQAFFIRSVFSPHWPFLSKGVFSPSRPSLSEVCSAHTDISYPKCVFSPSRPVPKACVQPILTFLSKVCSVHPGLLYPKCVFSPYWPFISNGMFTPPRPSLCNLYVQSIQAFFIQSVCGTHPDPICSTRLTCVNHEVTRSRNFTLFYHLLIHCRWS
jgi:hypothetical protein